MRECYSQGGYRGGLTYSSLVVGYCYNSLFHNYRDKSPEEGVSPVGKSSFVGIFPVSGI